jgi:hypothetical protein
MLLAKPINTVRKEVKKMTLLATGKVIGLFLLCTMVVLVIPAQPVSAQCYPEDEEKTQVTTEVVDLTIDPSEVTPGQKVTVRALVANSADVEEVFTIDLKVNGEVTDSTDVTLKAGGSQLVEFGYTPQALGTYNITVGDRDVTLEVTPVAPEPVTPEPQPEPVFRLGPVVRLRPVTDQIASSADGLVELFFSNPSLNEVTLQGDCYVSVPSGIHVYGDGFGTAAGAGTVYGQFTVPPGMARTIYLNIKADKTTVGNTYFIHFSGTYWPEGNKDAWNPISLTHPFTVLEASPEPLDATPTQDIPGEEAGGISWTWSGFGKWIVLALVVVGGIAAIVAVVSRKTEVSLER